jgi:hypothetical protein
MRCYLMRKGHIESVEVLDVGSDAELIAQGKAHFARRGGFDGFEVWDGKRRIYVYPTGRPSNPEQGNVREARPPRKPGGPRA